MGRRRTLFLTLTLLFLSVCTMACTGPAPTTTPPFFKFLDVVDILAVAPDGTVWAGTDYGVARCRDGVWTLYTKDDGLVDSIVNKLTVTSDGTLWVGTHTYVSAFDGARWATYTEEDGLASRGIRSIVAAPDSTVWVTYYG